MDESEVIVNNENEHKISLFPILYAFRISYCPIIAACPAQFIILFSI
jgi:hypothetical protein